MPKIDSLYELIKRQVKEKGRPLKVIADWDECLFAYRPTAIYKFSDKNMPFEQFFDDFWENSTVSTSTLGDHSKTFVYEGKFKEAFDKHQELSEERKKADDKNDPKYQMLDVIAEMPILTTAEEILKALKEDLISELVVTSTTRNTSKGGKLSFTVNSRKKRLAKNLGNFPQCKLDISVVKRDETGKYRPYRWEFLKEKYPDFDLYLDDDSKLLMSIKRNLPHMIYVIMDYKKSEHIKGHDIYRLKNTVSDLKDEDFAKAAQEYKAKKEQEKLTSRTTTSSASPEREHLKATLPLSSLC